MTLCECGCGQEVRHGNRFILGHNVRGKHRSDETKMKISDAQSGEKHHFYGKHHSVGTKKKISVAHLGVRKSDDARKKMSDNHADVSGEKNHMFGKHHSADTRKKMSLAQMGACVTDETREKHSVSISGKRNHNYGKTRTEESRRRSSAALQGIAYDDWEAYATNSLYCPAFDERCRESNREKYGRKCFICGLPESENITRSGNLRKLSVHHVDMNKMQGCDDRAWKLIPVCMSHHMHNNIWEARITYLLNNVWRRGIY